MFAFNSKLSAYQLTISADKYAVAIDWLLTAGCDFSTYFRSKSEQVCFTFESIPQAVVDKLNEKYNLSSDVKPADNKLEFLFSKDQDEWSEEELLDFISGIAPEVTPSSFEIESLWNLAVGLAGTEVEENSTNTSYIYFAYQCIEHPAHWCLFPNSSWDDDSDVDEMPQSLMASLLVKTLTV